MRIGQKVRISNEGEGIILDVDHHEGIYLIKIVKGTIFEPGNTMWFDMNGIYPMFDLRYNLKKRDGLINAILGMTGSFRDICYLGYGVGYQERRKHLYRTSRNLKRVQVVITKQMDELVKAENGTCSK